MAKKKRKLHNCTCETCERHPHSKIAKEYKKISRKQDERRDEQIRHMIRMRKRFLKRKLPVLSVDCKKKELIGQFRNPGRTWRQQT